ncbi:uncharacterized protein LOC119722747 [Patiria miniata]|uniref:Nerve growth factor-related domain-containing protein n=1 Tax=Patiria miniata TaxID=46514 RepID=A0A913ZDF2_PATMI|nr:uncharacterized protein LOC119722747 [Patiria miniata]
MAVHGMRIRTVIHRIPSFSLEEFKMHVRAKGATAVIFLLVTVILGKTGVDTRERHQQQEPFFDILDIPPELRNIPERPTIYDLLTIPSLEEAAVLRISFAQDRPSHMSDLPPSGSAWKGNPAEFMSEPPLSIFKRDHSPPLRACPVKNEWIHVQTATDIYNEEVEVSQIQWFWHTTCLHENQACYGFSSSDEGTTTECRETNSWVMAWARVIGETDYSWRHIAIPTCCSCAVIESLR